MPNLAQARRFFRPTWAEVNLSALASNFSRFSARLSRSAKLMFVVKANAYGHGAVVCAQAAERSRLVHWLGVSSVEEGISLREAGIRLPILILGSLYPFESFLAAVEYGLTPTVASLESAQRLTRVSSDLKRPVACHLKIETGMGRIGVSPNAALGVVGYLLAQKTVRLSGVYTHFSCADTNREFTKLQLKRFRAVLSVLKRLGARALIRHAANSAAALAFPPSRLDLVRPGLALYGLCGAFEPALSLKSRVVFIKNLSRGVPVSYGALFCTGKPSRIATVAVGYADGVLRSLSGKGWCLIRGRKCPIIGAITMDMMMLDATRVPEARVGDEVVLIGRQGDQTITAGELARAAGTIPYEVTTAISNRVPRVYHHDPKVG